MAPFIPDRREYRVSVLSGRIASAYVKRPPEATPPDGLRTQPILPLTPGVPHIVVENSSTHKTPLIKRWLLRHPRFQVHFTPTYSSWINQVERWFALLTEKQLRRGTHKSTRQLEDAIRLYLATSNESARPFAWTKTADEILASIARFCQRTSVSGH